MLEMHIAARMEDQARLLNGAKQQQEGTCVCVCACVCAAVLLSLSLILSLTLSLSLTLAPSSVAIGFRRCTQGTGVRLADELEQMQAEVERLIQDVDLLIREEEEEEEKEQR